MLWAWEKKKKKRRTQRYNGFIYELHSCCSHTKHSKVYDACVPLILNKAAKPIHCAGSICNKFIHPYRHTRKQDTQGERDRGMDREMEGYISPSLSVSLGVLLIRAPLSLYSCKLLCHLFPQQSVLPNPPMMYHYHNFGWKSIESIGLSGKLTSGIAYTLWGLFIH